MYSFILQCLEVNERDSRTLENDLKGIYSVLKITIG